MNHLSRTLAIVAAISLAAPVWAQSEAAPAEEVAPVEEAAAPEATEPGKKAVPQPTTPEVAVPPVEWYCACYDARLKSTGVMQTTTSCRPSRDECDRLEAMVRTSTGRYAMGPEGRSCRLVKGKHPMDTLGGQGGWRHSDKAGSWVFPGQCMLR